MRPLRTTADIFIISLMSHLRSAYFNVARTTGHNLLIPVIIGLIAFLALVFVFAPKHAVYAVILAPLALTIPLLVVPNPKVTRFLLFGLGLSLPFAHFVVVILTAFGIQWNIQWANIFGGLLLLHLFIRVLIGNPLKLSPGLPWLGLFICATFLAAFNFFNEPPEHANKFINYEILLFLYVLLFLAITQVRTDSKHLLVILKAMLALSAVVGLYGIYQLPARYFGLPLADIRLTNPQYVPVKFVGEEAILNLARPNSIFSEPGFFGHYLVPLTAIGIILTIHRPRIFGSKIILWLIVLSQVVSLAFTFSIGSYIAMGFIILLMLLIEKGKGRTGVLAWIVFGIPIIFITFSIFELLTGYPVFTMSIERLFGLWKYMLGDISYLIPFESAPLRLNASRIALEVFTTHPVNGVGLGLFGDFAQYFVKTPINDLYCSPFSILLAETGILGAFSLFGFWICTLRNVHKIIRKPFTVTRTSPDSDDGLAIVARLIFYLVLSELIFFHIDGFLFVPTLWYYLGLGNLVIIVARNRKPQTA